MRPRTTPTSGCATKAISRPTSSAGPTRSRPLPDVQGCLRLLQARGAGQGRRVRSNDAGAARRVIADVIIVGAGGMGTAAAFHLGARADAGCWCSERCPLAHDRGSSHGLTRIIRLAYFEHPSYVLPLLPRVRSVAGPGVPDRRTSAARDRRARRRCPERRRVRGARRVLHRARRAARGPERCAPAVVASRPGGSTMGRRRCLQPDGGFLLPERRLLAHAAGARRAGAVIRGPEPVVGVGGRHRPRARSNVPTNLRSRSARPGRWSVDGRAAAESGAADAA